MSAQPEENESVAPPTMIEIALIDVPEDYGSLDEPMLRYLEPSIRVQGQLQAIGVWPQNNGRFRLVFGGHRLEVAKRLNQTHIEATELYFEDDQERRVYTYTENILRKNLTAAEKALGFIALKDFLAKDPTITTKRGTQANLKVGPLKIHQPANEEEAESETPAEPEPPKKPISKAIAEKTGLSKSVIHRQIYITERIGENALKLLRPIANTPSTSSPVAWMWNPRSKEPSVRSTSKRSRWLRLVPSPTLRLRSSLRTISPTKRGLKSIARRIFRSFPQRAASDKPLSCIATPATCARR
jgi:hypothetical protein